MKPTSKTQPKSSLKPSLIVKILSIAFRARPLPFAGYIFAALTETGTFAAAIYASAKLGGLLARYHTGMSTDRIWFWLLIDMACLIATGICFWLMEVCKRLVYFSLVKWSTRQFHEVLCKIDIKDFYEESIRNKINKVQAGYTWQVANFSAAALDLVYAIIRFSLTAIIVAQINWWLVPLIALFLIPTLALERKLAKVQWFVWDDQGDTRHLFWGMEWIIRQVKCQMELRSLQAKDTILNRLSDLNEVFYRNQEKDYKSITRWMLPTKVLENTGAIIGSVVLLLRFLRGAIALDRYLFLSGALLRISSSLNTIFGTLGRMQESMLFMDSYFELMSYRPVLIDPPNPKKLTTKKAPLIEFDHVTFTYPGNDKPVFDDLCLTIQPGMHLAIVGENGAGKSTLIKLLLRFYRPTSGTIKINGEDLQGLAIDTWYEHLATLFQDFNHYPFTIAENITIAKRGSKQANTNLAVAAQLSNVDSFVEKYPHGWDTVLDNSFEKGTEPSGGQWQRVALARAFYRDANVLILDEPTAAIDAKAEYDIFNNIFQHYQNRTTIIVSHRFSTVRRADIIVVIEAGKITETGTHRELMKLGGVYYDLFTKQAEGYQN